MEVIVKGQPSIEIGFETKVIQVGGLGDIDSALSTESENPVMNKVITAELSSLGDSVVVNTNNISSLAESKADKDGVYSGMTVGRSIDLLGVEDVEEGSFLFRPTDGDGSIKDGVAVVKSVKGDSVVWNQLTVAYNSTNTTTLNGIATEREKGQRKIHVYGTYTQSDSIDRNLYSVSINVSNMDVKVNHTYLIEIVGTDKLELLIRQPFYKTNFIGRSLIAKVTDNSTSNVILPRIGGEVVVGNPLNETACVNVHDLTQMFGAGNEPSTIEEFNARVATLCIEDMNAYNEGEVVNMKASAIKSVGFNAWDEEWEVGKININDGSNINTTTEIRSKNYSKVLPSTEYYIETPNTIWIAFLEYDADKNYLRNRGGLYGKITTSPDCHYLRFYTSEAYGTTYNHDICINLVHSGYRNGEYEPYVEDVLALPTLDLFPNGMNKIGDVYDEYDSEKSVQRIGIRPYQSGDESIENVLTDGTTTIYVLEEPIVTPHDYRLTYKAWDFGTEQVIADGNTTAITAGIIYEFNARDTIRGNKTRLDVLEPIVAGKIDKNADDYYPQLAVGLADNLSGVDVVDSEINFRRSGGGAISDGVARIEAIKGNSAVWNQLFPREQHLITNNGINAEWKVDGSVILNGTTPTESYSFIYQKKKTSFIQGHKYAVWGTESSDILIQVYISSDEQTTSQLGSGVFTCKSSISSNMPRYRVNPNTTLTDWKGKIYLVDLTKAFPNDWQNINTIEEFYSRIPMGVDLNAYNEGEVIHMDVQSIESQGVNAWDEKWENGTFDITSGEAIDGSWVLHQIRSENPLPVLPNEEYYVSIGKASIWAIFLDKEGNAIESPAYHGITAGNAINIYNSGKFKTPTNAAFLIFYCTGDYGSTYNHDICINLGDTSINGKYFPYIKRVEDLSIIRKYFPQGMKSVGSAHDEIRYNKATQKWEMVQRIGEVDMGTLKWGLFQGNFYLSFGAASDIKINSILLCSAYNGISPKGLDYSGEDKAIWSQTNASDKTIVVRDTTYTDVETFKAMLQEKQMKLYYELAEPIVTELDAEDQFRDLDYQVWNCGTEKAIAEGKSAPLAADITYGFNAIGKIKELESLVAQLRAKVGI